MRWSGVAINATNRVHQCVFYPLSYWIHGGAAGDEYIWLFPTSAAMLDHPTRHAPPHMSCGRRWRTGRASGPYSSRRPRGWSALILYGRYGLIGRLSVSPIQIVWGFPPYVLYGQTSAYFQKWTGGGKTTLIYSTIPGTVQYGYGCGYRVHYITRVPATVPYRTEAEEAGTLARRHGTTGIYGSTSLALLYCLYNV